MRIFFPVLFFLFLPLAFGGGNERIAHFRAAKKIADLIHREHPFTLYCGCRYSGKKVDLQTCGYQARKDPARAARLEWEHVVPAEAFGQSFPEWRVGAKACKSKGKSYKGRRCAGKNPEFARMEGDLYNLWPEISELNRLRQNFAPAALGGAARNPSSASFGGCAAVVTDRKFEPMDRAKGITARTYLYMDQAYPGRGIVSGKNRKLFEAWDKMFPVTEWECRRGEKIRAAQGNINPVLKDRCAKAGKKEG